METTIEKANLREIAEVTKLPFEFNLEDLALLEQNMTANGLTCVKVSPSCINFKDDRRNILVDEMGLHCDAAFWKNEECTEVGPMQRVYINEPTINMVDLLTKLDVVGVIDATFDMQEAAND